ncbi:MAG: PleD family two-component system response regulator [Ahrensia sp.]|nr:PleD family two-component system response regulator [Ahrensia sp.]
MSARVLVVDDIEANVKLLQARLEAEYFEVITASNGADALQICKDGLCDIVLLDVMMPGMDGYEVCRRLKSDSRTMQLPIVMVTALDQPSDRLTGLEAGADDFLTKPAGDLALLTRVKSLARMKMVTDELQLRITSGRQLGLDQVSERDFAAINGLHGQIIIINDLTSENQRLMKHLGREHTVELAPDPQEALYRCADNNFDLAIISLSMRSYDGLRLCSQLRSVERTRMLPILLLAGQGDEQKLVRGIDLGVNDYINTPIDTAELKARVKTQVKRKRLNDKLRESVHNAMEAAVRDPLTGLNNRRYFDRHVSNLFDQAMVDSKPLSLIALDIDHFKAVNDSHGHQAGDEVLKCFADRISRNVRGKDLAYRFGGEEFVVVMPSTDKELAYVVADRMRQDVGATPITTKDGAEISITVSAGIASIEGRFDTLSSMLKRADEALYNAKRNGRNKVVSEAA